MGLALPFIAFDMAGIESRSWSTFRASPTPFVKRRLCRYTCGVAYKKKSSESKHLYLLGETCPLSPAIFLIWSGTLIDDSSGSPPCIPLKSRVKPWYLRTHSWFHGPSLSSFAMCLPRTNLQSCRYTTNPLPRITEFASNFKTPTLYTSLQQARCD